MIPSFHTSFDIATLGSLCDQIRGVTYRKADARNSATSGYLPVLRANNIGDGELSFDDLVYVPDAVVKTRQRIRKGDIVVATSSGSLAVVGKTAQAREAWTGSFGAFCKLLRPKKHKVDPRYIALFLQTPFYRNAVSTLAAGANINNLRNEHLADMPVPIPHLNDPSRSLAEQQRIAAILDQADAIRRKRREAITQAQSLIPALFHNMFGDPVLNPNTWKVLPLAKVSDIASGVTKGRSFEGKKTVMVPYMRVASVQDGYLALDDITEIEVLAAEVEKYRLEVGDVLLTEGGDPDKLGRGAVWKGEIETCIHQNHIFRVRPNRQSVLPDYLSALLGSARGKRYFGKAAKQTTGIASINMTQLKRFHVLLPPRVLQQRFADQLMLIGEMKAKLERAFQECHNLFSSLAQRAFKGEL